jgi:hypothetical protein
LSKVTASSPDAAIAGSIAKCFLNEALYQLVVFNDQDNKQIFHGGNYP